MKTVHDLSLPFPDENCQHDTGIPQLKRFCSPNYVWPLCISVNILSSIHPSPCHSICKPAFTMVLSNTGGNVIRTEIIPSTSYNDTTLGTNHSSLREATSPGSAAELLPKMISELVMVLDSFRTAEGTARYPVRMIDDMT